MHRTLLGTALTLTVLVAAPVAAEAYAGHQLAGSVRTAIADLAPTAHITRVEPHGRPFLPAPVDGEVSSAYVDLTTPRGTMLVIVERLHRATGRADRLLWFPQVASTPGLAPVRAPSGAYTPRGTLTLDGRPAEVTYTATTAAGIVRVSPAAVTVNGRTWTEQELPEAWRTILTPAPVSPCPACR